jgi:uncharacterized membrane protein
MIGTGLMLTLLVEVIVLRGDISRMNTVFKFYLQVWELFSIATAATIAWVVADLPDWRPTFRWIWTAVLIVLLFSAALFPLLAGAAKVRDRMTITAPRTLDGMRFMEYVNNHNDLGEQIDLPSDYEAIRWMQDNVEGTPVIVEANTPEYRWGSRYTIYTGLPSVLGWRWHQSQQRVAAPNTNVDQRLFDITEFYLTQSVEESREFLEKYQVEYVVLGSLERAYYEEVSPCRPLGEGLGVTCELRGYPMGMPTTYDIPPEICRPMDENNENAGLICPTNGLLKFDQMAAEGILEEVFRNEGAVIYRVIG